MLRGSVSYRHMRGEEGRSPIVVFMAIMIGLMAIGGVFAAWDGYRKKQERERIAAAELAAADQARAEQIRKESATQREAASTVSGERRDMAIRNAIRQVESKHLMTKCDGAMALGRLRATDEARRLEQMMDDSSLGTVRGCAAAALVDMGETRTALSTYERWARGDDQDLQRSALMGFGAIGPSAAEVALPYLTDALRSPNVTLRFLAVDSASRIGPLGRPLLQQAANDADERVRRGAVNALKGGR